MVRTCLRARDCCRVHAKDVRGRSDEYKSLQDYNEIGDELAESDIDGGHSEVYPEYLW